MTRATVSFVAFGLGLGVAACGRADFDAELDAAGTVAPNDGSANGGSNDAGQPEVGFGSGTVGGAGCFGGAFNAVAAAYSIGHGQYAGETEILLFDHAITCDANGIGAQAWDYNAASVPAGTQVLALEVVTTNPGTYNVSYTPPTATTAFAIYYEINRPAPQQADSCIAAVSGGTFTLSGPNGAGTTAGSYAVQLTGGPETLTGTFTAADCAVGWYLMSNSGE